MKKLKISIEALTQKLINAGYSPERLSVHERIVEERKCALYHKKTLTYHGFSGTENYLVFGACAICGAVYFFEHLSDVFTSVSELLNEKSAEEKAA